jgi:hypothetical protein
MPLFPVPKFIERESPIVGPLTFKQFIFILVTVLVCFILYHLLPRFLSLPLLIIVGAFGLALAFFKIGEIPFYQVLAESLNFFLQPKQLSWGKKRRGETFAFKEMQLKKEEKVPIKTKRESKLRETAIKIETKK